MRFKHTGGYEETLAKLRNAGAELSTSLDGKRRVITLHKMWTIAYKYRKDGSLLCVLTDDANGVHTDYEIKKNGFTLPCMEKTS